MCGRAILTLSAKIIKEVLEDKYNVKQFTMDDYMPNYNISPGQKMLGVINDGKENRASFLNWIFVPEWANKISDGYKFINARSETIYEKVTYKKSFRSKRCIVIVNGFYEWKRENKNKIPYRFYRENNELFALAGIWNSYDEVYGLSIITTEANDLMKPIHSRMPVVIKNENIDRWLDKTTDLEELKNLMKPIPSNYLLCHEVSEYVNSSKHNDIKCIKKINV